MQHSGSGEEHSDSGVKSAGTTINKQRGEHTKCKRGYNEDVVYTVICTNLACTGIALCSRETVLIVQYTQHTTILPSGSRGGRVGSNISGGMFLTLKTGSTRD